MMGDMIPARFTLPGLAALLVTACYGSHTTVRSADGGADADAPAGTCVEGCTAPYTAGVIACHEERRSCLLGCTGWDDGACIDPCEMAWNGCTYERDYEAERCMETCPCWEAFMACTEGCSVGPGGGCWTDCEREYGSCSGEDIVGMGTCLGGCATAYSECEVACDRPGDWADWVNCGSDCNRGWATCMGGCF